MTSLSIYTDGASSGNPGPGGYAAVIAAGRRRQEIAGGFRLTTNNRMELFAAIAGLEALEGRQTVRLVSDSQYLVESVNQGWVETWKSKGWRKTKKEKVPNADLWQRLLGLLERHFVTFEWVEGHAGHALNERANLLAQRALLAADLPADEGYELGSHGAGERQAGLFDEQGGGAQAGQSVDGSTQQLDQGSAAFDAPPASTGSARGDQTTGGNRGKVLAAGQACRKCGAPVEKRTPVRKVKPGQSYYYEYYLQCPKCGTIYLVDEAKRGILS